MLDELDEEISLAPPESMASDAALFRGTIMLWIDEPISKRRVTILKACDSLRDTLRAHGIQVVDSMITFFAMINFRAVAASGGSSIFPLGVCSPYLITYL